MTSTKPLDPNTIKDSMRVETITSSFSLETRNSGIKSSSFVSYTVKCGEDEGWSMEEARMAEAILAERVTKDLYADLGSRRSVDLREIQVEQNAVSKNYGMLIENLQKKSEVNTDALKETAMEVESGR